MSTTPPPPSEWRQQQADWQPPEPAPPPQPSPPTDSPYPPPPPAQPGYDYGYAQPAAYPTGEYASWGRRLAAILIDGLLVGIPLFIIGLATGLIDNTSNDLDGQTIGFNAGADWILFTLLVSLAYYGILEGGERGASVGKMAMGIQVRDAQTGGPIGVGKAVLRRFIYNILWYLLFIPGVINGLSPLWDARKQAWHDKAVNSVVVRSS